MGGWVTAITTIGKAIAGRNSARSHARSAGRLEAKRNASMRAVQGEASAWQSRASEMWSNYTTNIKPHENLLIDDLVKRANRPAEAAIAEAVGDTGVAYDKQQAMSDRYAQRRGVDTTDAAAMERQRLNGVERAGAEVSAANIARAENRDDRTKAAGAIYDLSGEAIKRTAAASGISTDLNSELIKTYTQLAARHRDSSAQAWGTVGRAVNSLGGQLFGGGAGSTAAATATGKPSVPQQGVISSANPDPAMSGYQDFDSGDPRSQWQGSAPGYKDGGAIPDGGKVVGPGTGRSDSVPAIVDERKAVKLSAGEYIIPAHIVRKKGTEFFDKMLMEGAT